MGCYKATKGRTYVMLNNTDGSHGHCVEQQSLAQEYTLYSSIDTKFKTRQSELLVRKLVTSEEHPSQRAQCVQRNGGMPRCGVLRE